MKKFIVLIGTLTGATALAQTGNVGINTTTPEQTLDVNGPFIQVRGQGYNGVQQRMYIGADGANNDIQIGSATKGVTDIAAFNIGDGKYMNFNLNNLNAQGTGTVVGNMTVGGITQVQTLPGSGGNYSINGVANTFTPANTLAVDANGVLGIIPGVASTSGSTSPWFNMATQKAATDVGQSIYHMSNVTIGSNSSTLATGMLNIYNTAPKPIFNLVTDNSDGGVTDDYFHYSYGAPDMTDYYFASGGSMANPTPLATNQYIFNIKGMANLTNGFQQIGFFALTYKGNGTTTDSQLDYFNSGKGLAAFSISPQNNFGINQATPATTLDVAGAARVETLPASGGNFTYNNASTSYTPVNTVVADANGVLGIVSGLATTGTSQNIYTTDGTVAGARNVNMNNNNITWAGGEQVYTNANAFRIVNGNSGMIFRNDGPDFYMLKSTDSNGLGGWTTNRPLRYNFSTGNLLLNSDPSDGNVGIGTAAPAAKLDVEAASAGAIKIADGTQGTGKVLVSDANGVGTWQVNTGNQNSLYQTFTADNSTPIELDYGVFHSIPGIEPITVPNAGKYELIFHSFFYNPGDAGEKSFYVQVFINGQSVRNDETYGYVIAGDANQNAPAWLNLHYPVIIPVTQPNSTITVQVAAYTGAPILLTAASNFGARNKLDVIYLGQ